MEKRQWKKIIILINIITTINLQYIYRSDCDITINPVCGINFNTYQNMCSLNKYGIKLLHKGPCNINSPLIHLKNKNTKTSENSLVIDNNNDNNSFLNNFEDINNANFEGDENGYKGGVTFNRKCNCNNKFNPVCDINGVTFINECRAKCRGYKIAHKGLCGDFNYVHQLSSSCSCEIRDNVQPVCGSPGIKYESKCALECFGDSAQICQSPCNCDFYYKPECGKNGITYLNQCYRDCDGVFKLKSGKCDRIEDFENNIDSGNGNINNNGNISNNGNVSNTINSGFCANCGNQGYDPVCGIDNLTYQNTCFLSCKGIRLRYKGACMKKIIKQQTRQTCNCPSYFLPYCGVNGNTYNNACNLNCERASALSKGVCLNKNVMNLCYDRAMSNNFYPVCGENNLTYFNEDMLRCDKVNINYEGYCIPIKNNNCRCDNQIKTVCSANGKSFFNLCYLKCAGETFYSEGPCEFNGKGIVPGGNNRPWGIVNYQNIINLEFAINNNRSIAEQLGVYAVWMNHLPKQVIPQQQQVIPQQQQVIPQQQQVIPQQQTFQQQTIPQQQQAIPQQQQFIPQQQQFIPQQQQVIPQQQQVIPQQQQVIPQQQQVIPQQQTFQQHTIPQQQIVPEQNFQQQINPEQTYQQQQINNLNQYGLPDLKRIAAPTLDNFVNQMIEKEKEDFLKKQEQQKIIDSQISTSIKEIEKKIEINEDPSKKVEIKKDEAEKTETKVENSLKAITEEAIKKILIKNSKPTEIIVKELNTDNQMNVEQDFTKIKRLKIIKNPVFIFKLPGLKMTNYLKYPYKEYSQPELKEMPAEKEIIDLIFKLKLENYQLYVNNAYKNRRAKEIDIIIGKEKLFMDSETEEIMNKGEMDISEDVKDMFKKNPALYYLYLYLSIKNGAVFLDHKFEGGFSIEDCLLYIYVKLWGNEPDNEI